MPSAPTKPRRWQTLRFRLMAWNAAVVVVTALVTLLGLREGVRLTLIGELDQLLSEDAREIELAVNQLGSLSSPQLRAQLDRKDAGHAAHQWFVQLSDTLHQVHYHSQHAPAEIRGLAAAPNSFRTVGQWRIYERGLPGLTIRVGSSLELIRDDIRRIDGWVALAATGVLLIAPLGGYWLAGRATQPLNAMMTTMAAAQPARLEQRLQIRGTGDEIDRLSSAFNSLLDRIGNYLEEHRNLLANSAHELRTPLAAIRSSIEVTLAQPRTADEYATRLAEILEESSSLEVLVNQLLLLAESEAERLQLHAQPVPLHELVGRGVEMFSGLAEHSQVSLTCSPLPELTVQGNPQHLRQVIYNLLDNALKFTPAGGQVTVSLQQQDRQAVITVRDSGVGIAEHDLPLIFDRFFRGVQPGEPVRAHGTGLGLSICRAIVRAHHGSIHASSPPDGGACFVVSLPL